MGTEAFLVNPRPTRPGGRKLHRPRLYATGSKHWERSAKSHSLRKRVVINRPKRRPHNPKRHRTGRNPLGELLVQYGLANPRRKRRTKEVSKVRHVKHTRRRHRPNRPYAYNMHRRRYRRNPSHAQGAVQVLRPMTWLPQVVTGGVSAGVAVLSPRIWGPVPSVTQAYLTQGTLGLVGAWLLGKFGLKKYSAPWLIGAGAIVIGDFVGRTLATAMGLSAYPYELSGSGDPYGSYYAGHLNAHPGGESTLFEPPTALHEFGTFEDVGAFPYGQ